MVANERGSTRAIKLLKPLVCVFLLYAWPAMAVSSFTFTEYNLAFVLGLSLPLVIIAFLLRKQIDHSWWFPIALTITLIWVLSTLSQPDIGLDVEFLIARLEQSRALTKKTLSFL